MDATVRGRASGAKRHRLQVGGLVAVCLAMTSCGGTDGADDPARSEDAGPVRYLSQTTFRGANRPLFMVSFQSGLTYGFYQHDYAANATLPQYPYDGMFIVRRAPGATDTDPSIGFDYSFEDGTIRPATLTWSARKAVGIAFGDLVTVTAGQPENTTESEGLIAAESTNANLPTDFSTVAGTYAGQFRSVNNSLRIPARIENSRLTATAADGCAIDATLRAHSQGNLYDVEATLGPGCPIGIGSFSGHALQTYVASNVFVFLESPTQGGIMLLLSDRQAP